MKIKAANDNDVKPGFEMKRFFDYIQQQAMMLTFEHPTFYHYPTQDDHNDSLPKCECS